MTKAVTGMIHVHSDYSSDGFCSIAELADFARETGLDFLALTDHAEDISPEDLRNLQEECEKHSDDTCVLIPGLEFRCSGDIHILGLGISETIPFDDAVNVATEIRRREGIAILAHPGRNGYECSPDLYGVLNGIEIWNAADDGQFVPPPAGLRLLREARSLNPAIAGFGGADLHWLDGSPVVTIRLQTTGVDFCPEMVLDRLRSGDFVVRGKFFACDARALTNTVVRFPVRVSRLFYVLSKTIRGIALGNVK